MNKISKNKEKIDNNPKQNEKKTNEFQEFADKKGPEWAFAFFFLSPTFDGYFPPKALERFKNLPNEIRNSNLDEEEKNILIEFYNTRKRRTPDDFFDDCRTADTIIKRLQNEITKEETIDTIRVIKAWRENRVQEFVKGEIERVKKMDLREDLKNAYLELLEEGLKTDERAAIMSALCLVASLHSKRNIEEIIEMIKTSIRVHRYL